MFRDTDELAVTLTVAEWNQVLALLSEGLYRVVAPPEPVREPAPMPVASDARPPLSSREDEARPSP